VNVSPRAQLEKKARPLRRLRSASASYARKKSRLLKKTPGRTLFASGRADHNTCMKFAARRLGSFREEHQHHLVLLRLISSHAHKA